MDVPSVGNPLLHAATLAAQKRHEAEQEDLASTRRVDQPAADPASVPSSAPQTAPETPSPEIRSRDELERLADDVLAIFDDSPDRLEQLVATLKRLEGNGA